MDAAPHRPTHEPRTPPRQASRPRRPWFGDDAITPVVGTSLILVITVLGMAGVLFWGTPTLQGIQDRTSVVGMEGEFDELRRASLELSVPDASRVPSVVLEDGTLDLEQGTRMMVALGQDAANPSCDLRVTGWDTAPSSSLVLDVGGCTVCDASCLEIHRVAGSTLLEQADMAWATGPGPSQWTATYVGAGTAPEFGTNDWAVRITNGGTTAYASAWILDQKRISWRLNTAVSEVQLHFEGGAIFEVDGGATYLHRPPPIREDAFGSEDYVLRLVTLLGESSGSAGRGTPEVFLGLVGNHVRASTSTAYQVRYDFSGEVAEAWCQSLLVRNSGLAATATTDRSYSATSACTSDIPSVLYQITDPSAGNVRKPFPFEFLHVRITSSIRV